MTTFSYYTTSWILRKFFQTFPSLSNPNLSLAHSLLHILFLSLNHSRSRMFLMIYIYFLLTYIDRFIICPYILHFVHSSILPSARIFFYFALLIVFFCLLVRITITYFSFDPNTPCFSPLPIQRWRKIPNIHHPKIPGNG